MGDWTLGTMSGERGRDAIREAVERIVRPDAAYPDIWQSIDAIHAAMYSITGILRQQGDFQDGTDTALPAGVAISPAQAAQCLFDRMRTVIFMRGVHAAVAEALRRFPGQRLEILYAGCGPYCPLMLPIATQFSPERVRIHLLDYHEESIAAARKVVERLGIEESIGDIVCCDAVKYRVPPGRVLHVAITETLKPSLEREPQVSISANLASQLCKGGILVPESIAVSLYLLDFQKEFEWMQRGGEPPDRCCLGIVFELTQESAAGLFGVIPPDGGSVTVPCAEIVLPDGLPLIDQYYLLTEIGVFSAHALTFNQSQLTMPIRYRLKTPWGPGDRLAFQYVIDSHPHFEIQVYSNGQPMRVESTKHIRSSDRNGLKRGY